MHHLIYSILRSGGVVALVLCSACATDPTEQLIGQWQAVSVTENGNELTLDPAEVQFYFGPDGRYRYESTLDYREAGYYRVVDGILLSRDTLSRQTEEKAVRIDLSSAADTLFIDMEYEGRPQQIILTRE